MSYNAIYLDYILHAYFDKSHFVNIFSTPFLTKKARVHVQQSVYRENCKYACFGTQNSRAGMENSSEHYVS